MRTLPGPRRPPLRGPRADEKAAHPAPYTAPVIPLPRTLPGLLLLCACTSAPVQPLPDPLPETLEFARAQAPQGGAFLGLEVRENDGGSLDELAFEPGVRVVGVDRNSPAARAGFVPGDVLLALDGERVDDPGTLEALLAAARPERTVQLEVRRGDSAFALAVPLASRVEGDPGPAPRLLWRADPARSRAGWLAGHGGVVLVTSEERGPFPSAGIRPGAVVLALEGEPVRSERALIRRLQALEPGARVAVRWRAPGEEAEREARVRLFAPPRRVTSARFPILFAYDAAADGSSRRVALVDLWLVWLLRYERRGVERHWSVLRFLRYSSGFGELAG